MARQNRKRTTVLNPILARLTRARENHAYYEAERLAVEMIELLARIMKRRRVSTSHLARRMGVPKGHVQESLLENAALQPLDWIAHAFSALGYRLHLTAEVLPKKP